MEVDTTMAAMVTPGDKAHAHAKMDVDVETTLAESIAQKMATSLQALTDNKEPTTQAMVIKRTGTSLQQAVIAKNQETEQTPSQLPKSQRKDTKNKRKKQQGRR
jgi:hypothetical protein